MTDAINITVSEHKPAEVPPGMLYKFKIVSHDELGNVVQPVFFVKTSQPDISVAEQHYSVYVRQSYQALWTTSFQR